MVYWVLWIRWWSHVSITRCWVFLGLRLVIGSALVCYYVMSVFLSIVWWCYLFMLSWMVLWTLDSCFNRESKLFMKFVDSITNKAVQFQFLIRLLIKKIMDTTCAVTYTYNLKCKIQKVSVKFKKRIGLVWIILSRIKVWPMVNFGFAFI